ncbi:MAG: prolipoprotein diacylglyceryl transferase [Cytophagales bacterium]|nr:prolipoprotein diacylglyceryl transferase [Cytophagales bacterium]
MPLLHYIIWNVNPTIFDIGSIGIRWYGLLFVTGFLVSQKVGMYIFQQEGKPAREVETLTLYIVLATVIGARLGHVLFYDFAYFSKHPLEIFLPISFEPTFKFVGYQGLASHGAAIGILIAVYLYANYDIRLQLLPPQCKMTKSKRKGQSYLWILDHIVIVVALAGCFIRLGNFMNAEIIGKPTYNDYGVLFARDVSSQLQESSEGIAKVAVFKSDTVIENKENYQPITLEITFKNVGFEEAAVRSFLEEHVKYLLTKDNLINEHVYEAIEQPLHYTLSKNRKGAYIARITTLGIPRHPAQLYESLSSFLLFLFFFWWWRRKKEHIKEGELIASFLIILFGLRFFYEFIKENQVTFEDNIPLNMGQWLSVPLVIAGIILLLYVRKARPTK